MPVLPRVFLSLPAQVTVPTFSFPAEVKLLDTASLPSATIDWEQIRMFFAALMRDITTAANNSATWVKDHPEEVKTAGLVVAAGIVLVLTLCTLAPAISAILSGLGSLVLAIFNLLHNLILFPIKLILKLVRTILDATLQCIGFTNRGVRAHSFAARGQSAHYGPNTGGIFSTLQSAGARRR